MSKEPDYSANQELVVQFNSDCRELRSGIDYLRITPPPPEIIVGGKYRPPVSPHSASGTGEAAPTGSEVGVDD